MKTLFHWVCVYAVKSRFMRAQGESDNECVISEIVKGHKTKEVLLWQIGTPIANINLKNIGCIVRDYKEYI
jgi:hypothetical protein